MSKFNYISMYSKDSLFEKIKDVFSKAGISVIYGVLLLFYALQDPNIPLKAKATILGALGYFIAPIDLVSDPIPVVGYGDDLTAITVALGAIAIYITEDTKKKAIKKTKELFKITNEEDFKLIEEYIKNKNK